MIEASPKVAAESPAHKIPYFSRNSSRLGLIPLRSSPNICFSTSISKPSLLRPFYTLSTIGSCHCPHVIIADDDPFEKFYYEILFQRSISFEELGIKREEFRIQTVSSGEELISQYRSSEACGCGSLALIVSDHNMGVHKLTGMKTAVMLRKIGYKGPFVLRTSETNEKLSNSGLEDLARTNTINCLLRKSDHNKTKEVLNKLLEASFESDRAAQRKMLTSTGRNFDEKEVSFL